jgi:photosystem I subunit PsaN
MATLASRKAVSVRAQKAQQPAAASVAGRRALLGGFAAALAAAALTAPQPAVAALEEDLLARSQVNRALNDKKRLATSYANLARTR